MPSQQQIVFIVGPTAVGKSEVGLKLAERIKGEIVCCDSMQVYQEIAIASNKPTKEDVARVPHHLFDIASVATSFDVATYNRLAQQCIKKIIERSRVPIIIGGSGLYCQILLDGIFDGHGGDEEVREKLKAKARSMGSDVLHRQLSASDPQAAQRIHPNDTRRIVRALEVYETSHRPISQLQPNRQGLWGRYDIRLFGLRMERQQLYDRINRRVARMVKADLKKETEKLSSSHLSISAQHLIGLKEMREHIEGKYDLDTAVELIKKNTRHFAKRQMTWFNKEKRIQWIDVDDMTPREVAALIESRIG